MEESWTIQTRNRTQQKLQMELLHCLETNFNTQQIQNISNILLERKCLKIWSGGQVR
jgi:hypothetical protein